MAATDPVADFIEAACAPLNGAGHGTGTLDRANAILAEHPDLPTRGIHVAAILGDATAVQRWLARDAASATAPDGPRGWDPLTYLCFSRYLRLDRARDEGFVRAATALLKAGASANTGWYEAGHQPAPQWESVLYGAAGVAHHAGMTRVLLERGADPNDEETPYHAAETHDNAALKILVEDGRLTPDSLATILLRKTDWHDYDGIQWLLGRGIDPDRMTRWGKTALHNAILSDNDLSIVELLLDHGANPAAIATRPERGSTQPGSRTAIAMAARRGRGDVLDAFARRGVPLALDGLDRLLAACAQHDDRRAQALVTEAPHLIDELRVDGGRWLAAFAGVGNTDGVRLLLDLGVDVAAVFTDGEGYFDVARDSLAMHVAAWRARHDTLKLLIARGSPIDVVDGKGRTPLMLAVRACVDSYWMHRRSPESVAALLDAGASATGVVVPSGDAAVDALLRRATA
jgi:hypothetical protein